MRQLKLWSCFFFLAAVCFAQIDRSSLTGVVRDSSGRLVPGTEVVATQSQTGLVRSTISNSTGAYELANLPAGSYRVSIKKSGFSDLVYTDVEQSIGLTLTLNPVLSVSARND